MFSRLFAVALGAAALAVPQAASAQGVPAPGQTIAPGLSVTSVSIESGRLIITGTTATANTLVTLERRFQARSNARGRFGFSLLYTVDDCIVDLSTSRGAGRAVVTGCGLKGATGQRGPTGLTGPARAVRLDKRALLDRQVQRVRQALPGRRAPRDRRGRPAREVQE